MGLFDVFSGGLTDRKAAAARRRFWAQAKVEAARYGRNEVWYADVLGICLEDAEARAAIDATQRSGSDLQKKVAVFQSPEERSDHSARSGAFIVTKNEFSWPLDRALDRAVAARQRQKASSVRSLDVLLGAISPDEQDLAKHIIEDCYALHFGLAWQVAHPGIKSDPEFEGSGQAKLRFFADPFTPTEFLRRQLTLVPELDDGRTADVLKQLAERGVADVSEGKAELLSGIQAHIVRERELTGHPLRVELEAA